MRRYPLQFTAAFWLIGCRFGPFTVHSKYPHVQARSFTGLLYIVAKLWLGNQCLQSVLSEHFNLESVFHLTFSLVRKLKEKFSRVGDLHARSLYWDFIELIMLLFSITNDVTHFHPIWFFSEMAAGIHLYHHIHPDPRLLLRTWLDLHLGRLLLASRCEYFCKMLMGPPNWKLSVHSAIYTATAEVWLSHGTKTTWSGLGKGRGLS